MAGMGDGMALVGRALGSASKHSERALPLDRIEQRRAQREAERLANYEAESARLKAQAAGTTAQAAKATQAAKAQGVADEKLEMQRIKALYTPTVPAEHPDYMRQKYRLYDAMTKSDNADVRDSGRELMVNIEKETGMASPGGQTMNEQQQAETLRHTGSEADLMDVQATQAQAGQTRAVPAPTPEDQTWALNWLQQNDPNKEGMVNFNPNWNDQQLGQYAQEIAGTLNQLRNQYANSGLTDGQLREMAINDFKYQMGMPGGVPVPPFTPVGAESQGAGGGAATTTPPQPGAAAAPTAELPKGASQWRDGKPVFTFNAL